MRSILIEEPYRARLAFRFIDERFHKCAKESVDVGLAHDEIERQLRSVALHVRHTLSALALSGLPGELGPQCLEAGGPEFGRPVRRQRLVAVRREVRLARQRARSVGFQFHALIMLLRRRPGIVRKSQVRMGDRLRSPLAPLPDCWNSFASPDSRAWKRIASERS